MPLILQQGWKSENIDGTTSGLPGNLLGDRLGRVQSGRVEPRDAASSTLVGATSLSLFIGNKRARKPLIAPNRLMT